MYVMKGNLLVGTLAGVLIFLDVTHHFLCKVSLHTVGGQAPCWSLSGKVDENKWKKYTRSAYCYNSIVYTSVVGKPLDLASNL
uniref:Uncharacterized protein n=1 Tax=Pyxicephalus adspersus TaxID=30357 RepID=A0AAV3AQL4_PYXAD|nr:TPA: hypothetical protein GDO54_012731 [Pyxicephalus adspersus]